MNGTVIAIIEFFRDFYLFDSHSKNRQGLAESDGHSLFLKFSRLEHVQNYIEVIHLEYQNKERQYFQLLVLGIQVDNMSKAIFQLNRTIRRLKRKIRVLHKGKNVCQFQI